MPARVENGSFYLSGTPHENRQEFLQFAESRVTYYSNGEYVRTFGSWSPYAKFGFRNLETDEGMPLVSDLSIAVDSDAFHVDGDSYDDLIPIVVRHEFEEIYSIIKTGLRISGGGFSNLSSPAHFYALREQYRYAFAIGKAERYIEFLQKSAPIQVPAEVIRARMLSENLAAYELVKSRRE